MSAHFTTEFCRAEIARARKLSQDRFAVKRSHLMRAISAEIKHLALSLEALAWAPDQCQPLADQLQETCAAGVFVLSAPWEESMPLFETTSFQSAADGEPSGRVRRDTFAR